MLEYVTINKLKSIGARETLIDFFWKNYRNGAFYEYDLLKEILSYNYYDFYWIIKIFGFPDLQRKTAASLKRNWSLKKTEAAAFQGFTVKCP